jgi:hypothetical protein
MSKSPSKEEQKADWVPAYSDGLSIKEGEALCLKARAVNSFDGVLKGKSSKSSKDVSSKDPRHVRFDSSPEVVEVQAPMEIAIRALYGKKEGGNEDAGDESDSGSVIFSPEPRRAKETSQREGVLSAAECEEAQRIQKRMMDECCGL